VGHCRRLGLGNGLHLPYLVDDRRYAPGYGQARSRWEAEFGAGFYVLSTARLDDSVKGNACSLFDALAQLVRQSPHIRIVSLAWGADAERFRGQVHRAGLGGNFIMLNPVGKRRLIDYYRSCDCVLDQFVYGYYGATGLEALAVGKPVVMYIRQHHYAPLYDGDIAPVVNCSSAQSAAAAIVELARDPARCQHLQRASRDWLVRHHGREKIVPELLALLRVAAGRIPLPPELSNPLWEELSADEIDYHQSCLVHAQGDC
jgi:glycosyltransferase involved in cell wall biosynthesis